MATTEAGTRANLARAAAAFATNRGAHPTHVAAFTRAYLAWTDTGLRLSIRTAWAAYAALVEYARAEAAARAHPMPGYRATSR